MPYGVVRRESPAMAKERSSPTQNTDAFALVVWITTVVKRVQRRYASR